MFLGMRLADITNIFLGWSCRIGKYSLFAYCDMSYDLSSSERKQKQAATITLLDSVSVEFTTKLHTCYIAERGRLPLPSC